jgi:hypothetical protein
MNNNKTNKVVVINPETQSVYEAQIPAENTLQGWYKTIGNGCELVQVVLSVYDKDMRVDNALLMDEEILLRTSDIKGAFYFDGRVFFNTAIFSGADEEGETCDCTIDASIVNKHVQFMSQADALQYAEEVLNNNEPIIYFA